MAAVALGLLIAAAFGSGDYIGGRASARAASLTVIVLSQVCSVAGAVLLVALVPAHATAGDLVRGFVAGGVNVIGLGLLYDGLARYSAAVVAPVTAVVASVVPVAWGFAHGEQPGAIAVVGIAVAIVAGGAIAVSETGGFRFSKGSAQAALSGLGFGCGLVLYSTTAHSSGQWPVLAGRAGSLLVAAVAFAVLRGRQRLTMPRGVAARYAVVAGFVDVSGTGMVLVAVRHHLLVVVTPVIVLAPAITVVLARVFGRQRLRRTQWAGLALAAVGLVLIATG